MFVHPTGLNNAPLVFNVGAGQTTQFNTLALVAEPLADVPPTVPPSCNVQEAILTADPADPTFNVSVTCASNAECQGARTCVNTGGILRCTGHASAACCSHVNSGACLSTDPYCSVCMPSLAVGGSDGHTFRLRSKLYPTMYVVASPSAAHAATASATSVSRVANRPGAPRRFFNLDADGFRANHESRLSEMAKKLAVRVAKEGKVVTFDPMSARDRRVVHRALSGLEGVKTESSGEEPNRRVHIMPSTTPSPSAS